MVYLRLSLSLATLLLGCAEGLSPSKVVVAGATGRTGSVVVKDLLDRNVQVVGLVRSRAKVNEVFDSEKVIDKVKWIECDLTNVKEIAKAVEGCDGAVWCATGFSNAPTTSWLDQVKRLIGIALPQRSIDYVGLPALASVLSKKVVMLSSAGVTRPSWDEAEKEKYPGAADIPIVRLNPFGILDIKKESEQLLRDTGVDYCIVRPCGLNEDWPAGSRVLFSQGDVAVGRINRKDVATLLVDCLLADESSGKTFEVVSLQGYPPARDVSIALGRLQPDASALSAEQKAASYALLQQLLPGETQDSAALAMGQTYEELDQGQTGRLGERGTENAEAAAPQPTM